MHFITYNIYFILGLKNKSLVEEWNIKRKNSHNGPTNSFYCFSNTLLSSNLSGIVYQLLVISLNNIIKHPCVCNSSSGFYVNEQL